MNPDTKVAARYLEGALSVEDADRFERENLGQSHFRQYLEETGLLEKYVRGELSGIELDTVEKALLADPDLLTEMDELTALDRALSKFRSTAGPLSAASRRRSVTFLYSPQYAAAASIVAAALLVFSGYLFVDNQELQERVAAFPTSFANDRIQLLASRGLEDSNSFQEPGASGFKSLDVNGGVVRNGREIFYDEYRATVLRTDGADPVEIIQTAGLPLGYDNSVSVLMPGGLLVAGSYEVDLAGRMSDWPAGQDYESIRTVEFEVIAGN